MKGRRSPPLSRSAMSPFNLSSFCSMWAFVGRRVCGPFVPGGLFVRPSGVFAKLHARAIGWGADRAVQSGGSRRVFAGAAPSPAFSSWRRWGFVGVEAPLSSAVMAPRPVGCSWWRWMRWWSVRRGFLRGSRFVETSGFFLFVWAGVFLLDGRLIFCFDCVVFSAQVLLCRWIIGLSVGWSGFLHVISSFGEPVALFCRWWPVYFFLGFCLLGVA